MLHRLLADEADSIMKCMVNYVGRELGDYRIVEQIGAGGMGKVFLAENVHHRKKYALKILPPELSRDANFRKRFFDEARVMSELEHSNIVRVHHMGEDQGTYYLVMDYVVGPDGSPRSVHEELVRDKDRRISPRWTHRLILQVAHGLAYAHKRGVIHRDIKPANILIDENGDAKITDFGLVKAIGKDFLLSQIHETIQQSLRHDVQPTMTLVESDPSRISTPLDVSRSATITKSPSGSSGLFGTYDYMSPELLEGQDATEQSDVYSLGITIYRMLTGRRAVGMAKPPSELVPGLPKRWDVITKRCIAENLQSRYHNLTELISDLHRVNCRRRVRALVLVGFCSIMLLGSVSYIVNPEPYRSFANTVVNTAKGFFNWNALPPKEPPPDAAPPSPGDQGLVLAQTAEDQLERILDLVRRQTWLSDVESTARIDLEDVRQMLIAGRYEQVVEKCDSLGRDLARRIAKRTEEEVLVGFHEVSGFANVVDAARRKITGLESASSGDHLNTVNGCIEIVEGLAASAGSQLSEAIRGLELLSGSDVFSAGVEMARSDMDYGDRQAEAKRYPDAIQAYTKGLHKTTGLREVVEKYEAALVAETEAKMEQSHALESQADRCVCGHNEMDCECFHAVFRRALVLLEHAETCFQVGQTEPYELARGQFDLAIQGFSGAADLFKKAVTEIQELAEVLRTEWLMIQSTKMPGELGKEFETRAEVVATGAEAALERGQPHAAILGYRRAIRLKNLQRELSLSLSNGATLSLVFVPKGEFWMGSPRDERGRRANEQHQLTASISKGFYIGIHEVTQIQYKAVMGENPSTFDGPGLPVENVSWYDAKVFCEKLTSLGHGHFRLPSETEWEYACRAGSRFAYSEGNSVETGLKRVGWYRQSATDRTKPVGQRDANRFGLYDMHGNVWEWCETAYAEVAQTAASDPNVSGIVTMQVLRGGSWRADALDCRSATRVGVPPETKRDDIGFRVVMDVDQ